MKGPREASGAREQHGRASAIVPRSTLGGSAQESEADEPALRAERKSVATHLVELATGRVGELWHDPAGEAYATLAVDDHHEHHPLRGRGFRAWLERLYYAETERAANAQAVQDALGVLSGAARFEGAEYTVHTRLARHEDRLYLDLGDDAWRVVEIDAHAWRVLARSPVKFRRPRGMLPLPAPVEGGAMGRLRDYLNIDKGAWPLVVGWLAACYAPSGPYPVLILVAEQGSGKTTTARVLRALVDPNVAPLRSEPRESRDLMIAAKNGAVVMLDNLSRIPAQLSDDLCRLATGGGLGTRQLYSDDDETLFDATRPVLITGIDDLADRGDLLDRAIIVGCPTIGEGERRTERELWAAFERERPALLGALLTAVSTGLRELPHTKLPTLPRMADATLWVTACERALGLEPGTFAERYAVNRRDANDLALDVSPIPDVLRELLADHNPWEGTATELLADLDSRASERTQSLRNWPKSARALGNALRRLAPNLRATGVEVEFVRQAHTGVRLIRLGTQPNVTIVTNVTQGDESCQGRKDEGDIKGDAKIEGDANVTQTSPSFLREGRSCDDGDNRDAKSPTHSNATWDEV